MATIADVASEANVSTATVSRVLNGSYSVTEEKKRRVMEAIEKVGYQIPERTLQNKRTELCEKNSVLLVICSNWISEFLQAFQSCAGANGYHVVSAHYENAEEFGHLSGLIAALSPVLAGIVLINAADNSRRFQSLIEEYPLVQIGEPIMERAPNLVVYNDEIKMSQDATNYLLDHGCRNIGILTTEPSASTALFYQMKRLNGYYLALMNRGIPVDQSYSRFVDVSIDGGYEGAKELLASHPELDAIIGITDAIAQGAVYAIRRAGKSTDEVKVFSLDNNEVWDFDNDDFPYINPHHDEMAVTAFHVLHAAISGEIPEDYRVVIRHTLQQTKHPYNTSMI